MRTYGLITLACLGISLLLHFLSVGLSNFSSFSDDLIGKAAEQAVSQKIKEATKGH